MAEAVHRSGPAPHSAAFDFESPPWSLFSAVGDAFAVCQVVVDDDGNAVDYLFLHVNEHFTEATGLVDPEGRTALEMVPDLEWFWVETYGSVGLGGETLAFEQGSEVVGRWWEVVASPIDLERGFVIVFKDRTDRHRNTILAEEHEQRVRAIADELPVMAWLHDADGRQLFVNQTYCEFFGVTREEMVGDRWTSLAQAADNDAYLADFAAAVDEQRPFVNTVQCRRADGEWRTLESWGTPRFDADGNYLGHIGASIDVTDRMALERERAELLDRERQARRFAELLARYSATLAAATTEEEIATCVLDHVGEVFDVAVAGVNLVDGEEVRLVRSIGVDDLSRSELEGMLRDTELPGPEAIRTGEEIVIGTREELGRRYPLAAERFERYGIETLVALPIRRPMRPPIGAFVSARPSQHAFSSAEIDLLRELLRRSGDALERAYLHEQLVEAHRQEQAIALRLQDALLPDSVVEHPGVEIAARYLAAEGPLEVGGDWYDTYAWPEGRIGAVVGDVVGHDLEAAAHMGRLRAATGALIPRGEPRTATIMGALDRCARGPEGVDFVTAACVVIDVATGELEVSCAGHPPPLLVESDGTHRWLDDSTVPPIGQLDIDTTVSSTFTMGVGDVVLLYTDGLIERRNRSMGVGMRRLRTVAPVCLEGPLDAAVDEILADLVGTEAGDDVMLIALRWSGPCADAPTGPPTSPPT